MQSNAEASIFAKAGDRVILMGRKSAGLVAGLTLALFVLASMPAAAQSGEELFDKAGAALSADDATSAADLYGQAIRSGQLDKSKLSHAFMQRGRAYQLTGSHARAVADLTNALWLDTLSPSDQARAHGWRAASRQALGQADIAGDDLAKAKALDPQFAAAPAAPAAVAAGSRGAQSGAAGDGQPEGLLDRLLSTGPERREAQPARPATVVAQPRRPARETAVASRAAEPAPVSESGPLGSLTEMGQNLWSGWFGADGSSAQQPAQPENEGGVTVREVQPTAPVRVAEPTAAPAGSGAGQAFLARILPESDTAPTGAGASEQPQAIVAEPRAKPRPAASGNGPVRLVNLEREEEVAAPAQPAAGSGIMESLFGGESAQPTPVLAPSATPETITYSESRVASAPPWTLGADNASSREERAQLPSIPPRPVVRDTPSARAEPTIQPVQNRADDAARSGGTSTLVSNIAPSIDAGSVREPDRRAARGRQNWMAPQRARETREPVPLAAPATVPVPEPVQVAAAETPGAQPQPRTIPAPRRTIAAAQTALPADIPSPADARVFNTASLDWDEATEVGTTPVPVAAANGTQRSAARTIPAPRRALQPVSPALESVAVAQPVNVASLDWDAATRIETVRAPAPAPVASPRLSGTTYVAAPRQIPAPERRLVAVRPAAPPPASPEPSVGGSVASRIFEVASQAFSSNYRAMPEPERRAATPVRRAGSDRQAEPARATADPARGGTYAVQVYAQRTEAEAEASAASIQRRYGDLFGGGKPFVVRAEVPGKGTFYRVRVGPFAGNQAANSVCQQLKGRGTDCFAVRL